MWTPPVVLKNSCGATASVHPDRIRHRSMLDVIETITAKRDGRALSDTAIRSLISAYARGLVPDYQMSAFLMAAFLKGLSTRETTALTDCMLQSGIVLDFSGISGAKVDKHSTGGVGDKISLVLAPMAAACQVRVPMISGRALGHTGGTLDKLESIPGFSTDVDLDRMRQQLGDLGVVMLGQTEEIAPADGLLYALRDVTATVDFIPFITASIMSKKLAEGLDGLVLDVKTGRGAFMKTRAAARDLAEMLVLLGEKFGVSTVAWLTNMDTPLGFKIGNWLEVEESIDCLTGCGPADVVSLSVQLCGEMLVLAKRADTVKQGKEIAQESIDSGRAFESLLNLVAAQGGDVSVIEHPSKRKRTVEPEPVCAPDHARGFVSDLDAFQLGLAATEMGTGRFTKEDEVDPEAGIVLHKRPGDAVIPNEELAIFYTRKRALREQFAQTIRNAYSFKAKAPAAGNILIDRLSAEGWTHRS